MKKVISVLAAIVISVMSLSALTVSAEPELQEPVNGGIELYYTYTSGVKSSISVSGKSVTATSKINGISSVTKIVVTQTLQKKVSGAWSEPYPSNIKTFNSSSATYTNTYSNRAAGTYRVKTSAYVYKGSAYEKVGPVYSSAVTVS